MLVENTNILNLNSLPPSIKELKTNDLCFDYNSVYEKSYYSFSISINKATPHVYVDTFKKNEWYNTIAYCMRSLYPNKEELIISREESQINRNAVIDSIYAE